MFLHVVLHVVLQLKKSSEQKANCSDPHDKINPTEEEELDANYKDENTEYYEEADETESNIDDLSQHMPTSVTVDDSGLAAKSDGKPIKSKTKSDMQKSVLPEVCCAVLKLLSCTYSFIQSLMYESL